MSESRRDTICWNCENACGDCSWSRSFIPVEGWEALPRKMKLHNTTGREDEARTYIVISCPEFKADRKREKAEKYRKSV